MAGVVTEASKTFRVQELKEGKFTESAVSLVVEKELAVHVNGHHLATASLIPSMEKEFVVGYLFGQGFIKSAGEIETLDITDKGASAVLAGSDKASGRKKEASYRIVSGGGRTAYFESGTFPPIESGLRLERKEIFRAMNTLFEKAHLYNETRGVHAAALFDGKTNLLAVVEDIGRHNTLDKLIGYALLNRIDCSGVFMVSTGRMASEMVVKVCRAGIPLVATKTAVTDEGLRIAGEHGLTVIGFVRDEGSIMHTNMEIRVFREAQMKIYTGTERVL